MKKILFVFVLLLALAGCAFPLPMTGNTIRPMQLTEREKSLMMLVGAGRKVILLYEYEMSEAVTGFDVWVEVYEQGELVATPTIVSQGQSDPEPRQGSLAITIEETNDGTAWYFAIEKDDGEMITMGDGEPWPEPEEITASSWGKLDESLPVELDKEIALYSKVFTTAMNGEIYAYDEQEYVNNPEYIKQAEYLHLIKCKFSSEA